MSFKIPMNSYALPKGPWDVGVYLFEHTSQPVCIPRSLSVNKANIELTEVGNAVKSAKYRFSLQHFKQLEELVVSWGRDNKYEIVFYVPSRDANTDLNRFLANRLAEVMGLSEAAPVFSWQKFVSFRKGMSEQQISSLISKSNTHQLVLEYNEKRVLVIDDVFRTGSTLKLATLYAKKFFPNSTIHVFCITHVNELRRSNVRQQAENNFLVLYKTKYVELRKIVTIQPKIKEYIYLHESRSAGKVVAIVPYRRVNNTFKFLVRYERTPCWEPGLTPCAFTGGIDEGEEPSYTACRELKEESGIEINERELIYLGTCFGTKSSDTTYYLFSALLNSDNIHRDYHIESTAQIKSGAGWLSLSEAIGYGDPIMHTILMRTTEYLKLTMYSKTTSNLSFQVDW